MMSTGSIGGAFGKVLQAAGRVVPLHEVAHQGGGVLHRMVPFGARAALVGVDAVATEHDDGHAVHPGVVDGHGAMLNAHRAMHEDRHRFARRLGITMRHGDRRFFMQAGQQLGLFVAAVVHQRLMQAAKTRTRVGRHVVDV
jgi:hypothetical protein